MFEEINYKRAYDTLLTGKTQVNAVLFNALDNKPLIDFGAIIAPIKTKEDFKKLVKQLSSACTSAKYVKLMFYKEIRG